MAMMETILPLIHAFIFHFSLDCISVFFDCGKNSHHLFFNSSSSRSKNEELPVLVLGFGPFCWHTLIHSTSPWSRKPCTMILVCLRALKPCLLAALRPLRVSLRCRRSSLVTSRNSVLMTSLSRGNRLTGRDSRSYLGPLGHFIVNRKVPKISR